MKTLLTLTAALALCLPALAHADGLSDQGLADPVVTPPAAVAGDWTGPYAGLTYGRSSSTTSETSCFKLGQPKACDDPIFIEYPDYKVEVTTTTTTKRGEGGVFAGYRHDFGRLVAGAELGVSSGVKTAQLQLGADLGRVLAYGLVGFGQSDTDEGTIYGAGVDVKVGKRMLVGLQHFDGDLGAVTSLRVGITF